MNRHALLVVFSLVLVALITACQPAAPDTNRDAARTLTAASPSPTVDRAAIETEVLRMEREWTETIKSHNPDVLKRTLADDLVMTYPDGTVGTKASEIEDSEKAVLNAESWDLVDPKVTVLDADAAVVTGRTVVKNGKYKTPDGKTIDISGEYRFTDVFARRNGTWQVVASQATKIANPKPAAAASPKVSPATAPSPKGVAPATAPVPPAKSASSPAAAKTP